MCVPCPRTPSDSEIITSLAKQDFQGDIDADIARKVAADFLRVYPRSGELTEYRLKPFVGNDGKILPLDKPHRKLLADFIFPHPDSS